jgi:hypothetical protein
VKDCRGVDITDGAYVAVANRRGSSVWIEQKTVTGFDSTGRPILRGDKSTRPFVGSPRAIMVTVSWKKAEYAP